MKEASFDLSTFQEAQEKMIAKNVASWNEYTDRLTSNKIYSLEEIEAIIASGNLEEQRNLSRTYYDKNGFYKRILLYYATILKYKGILIPNASLGKQLSTPHIQKRYYSALEYISHLNIPELFTRISLRALIEGSYYGLIQTLNKDKCVLFDLPSNYCRSRFKDFAGNDVIEFNVMYFDGIISDTSRAKALSNYPKLVKSWYKKYHTGDVTTPWVIIPTDMGICFPFFDDGRPLFLDVIPAIVHYDEVVDIEQERELEEIRKIIVQKIPHLADGQLLFEPPEAAEMHSGAVGMMKQNKNISVLTTYADVDSIVSRSTSENPTNYMERTVQNLYAECGVSSELFAPTGSQALPTSITNDMALMMILAQKYSRLITYIINFLYGHKDVEFTYEILPISYYNQKEYVTDSLKLAQGGYSFLLPAIAMDLDQRSIVSIKDLENEVLKLGDKLKPLANSYSQSNSDSSSTSNSIPGDPGAPSKDITEKADQTIKNEESLNNQGGSN